MTRSGLPVDYRKGIRKREHIGATARTILSRCATLGESERFAYIYGSAGIGKTTAGCVLLAEWIASGKGTGRYITTPDLFADLFTVYAAHDGRSAMSVIDPLIDTDALLLDDIGKERATDHAAGIFFQLLDARYRDRRLGRWTAVVSNFHPDKLIDRFGTPENSEPIARRLTEGIVIAM